MELILNFQSMTEGSRLRIEIALTKHKERPHLSLLPAPVNPGARAAQDLRDAFAQKMEITVVKKKLHMH